MASPWRDRSVEGTAFVQEMREGKHEEGSMVLGQSDMAHANMHMRDPFMYRISFTPTMRVTNGHLSDIDFTRGQSDSIEGITHSLCSLEFENTGPCTTGGEQLGISLQAAQFARLNLNYTIMSAQLLRLVEEGAVDGWDDPRCQH